MTVCCFLGASAVRAYLHILMNIGGSVTFIVFYGCITWLLSIPRQEEWKRFGILMATAFFEGATASCLIQYECSFDPSILVTVLVGTAVAFGCFSCSIIVAKHTNFLYGEAAVCSVLSIFLWYIFGSSIVGHSNAMFIFEIYIWLLIFVAIVMSITTDKMIERAHSGNLDYMTHAFILPVDFVSVLLQPLIALKHKEIRGKV